MYIYIYTYMYMYTQEDTFTYINTSVCSRVIRFHSTQTWRLAAAGAQRVGQGHAQRPEVTIGRKLQGSQRFSSFQSSCRRQNLLAGSIAGSSWFTVPTAACCFDAVGSLALLALDAYIGSPDSRTMASCRLPLQKTECNSERLLRQQEKMQELLVLLFAEELLW